MFVALSLFIMTLPQPCLWDAVSSTPISLYLCCTSNNVLIRHNFAQKLRCGRTDMDGSRECCCEYWYREPSSEWVRLGISAEEVVRPIYTVNGSPSLMLIFVSAVHSDNLHKNV